MMVSTGAAPRYILDADGNGLEIRPVPGLPGYLVTENGDVYSKVHSARPFGKRIYASEDKDGYQRVEVSVDGQRRRFGAHRFVALAFIGPEPNGMPEVRHSDGNPRNNHYSNLAWSDHKTNMADRRSHGRNPVGEKNGRSLLDEGAVLAIKARLAAGDNREAIAKDHGVTVSAIDDIASGRNWSHVA